MEIDKPKIVLVTGANGFIGRGAVRNNVRDGFSADEYIQVGDINESTDWQQALAGVNTVIHLAARVHILNDLADDPVRSFHKVNMLGTEHLARMSAKAGVHRFVFISSIGVNGKFPNNKYFTEDDIPAPVGAYAVSKLKAEYLLNEVAGDTGMEVVILRSPLVYGPEVKANFRNLIKIAGAGLPLPFKGNNNRRSLIYLGNLIDAISTCITHPLASGEIFIVSDGQDVSVPDLIKMIACAMKKKVILFSLHPGILKALCKIIGKEEEIEKLTGTLLVDSSKIRDLLGWKAPFTVEEGIKETIKYYK
jgi:nucleoside-diphosphate-sugar epimerase